MHAMTTFAIINLLLAGRALAAEAEGTNLADNSFPVSITVDAGKSLGRLKPIWRMFGADEPNYATTGEGEKLLGELGALRPNHIYFRAHNLLCSGDGTPAFKWGSTGVYSEDANGRPLYNWKILDAIFDAYLTNGVRPYVEIGFMPEALSIHPHPYQHHWKPGDPYGDIVTGWAYPPKDYDKWRELVYQWVKHCVERYGRAEVETWYWEVWNEANGAYWKASEQEFFKLDDYAVDGVRRALPTARVGGPDSAGAGGRWMRAFIEHCLNGTNYATGKIGTPLDFISFHAKGSPSFVAGHVRMGIADQLRAIDSGFKIVKSYPRLKNIPIVIGESDPDGCAACTGDALGYRNTTMYSSYEAAVFAGEGDLARRDGVNLDSALTWAFTFAGQPAFAGYRQLASAGIDLPVLNVFRMFSQMGGRQLAVTGDGADPLDETLKSGVRGRPEVSAIASLDGNKLWVMIWHYHDDDVPGAVADVSLDLQNLSPGIRTARLTRYAIDAGHSNAFAVWQEMGSPVPLAGRQYDQVEKAGKLAEAGKPKDIPVIGGRLKLGLPVPRQAVELLVFDLSPGMEKIQ